MLSSPSKQRAVDAYIADEFETDLAKEFLAIINENNNTVAILERYSKHVAKELAAKFSISQNAVDSFKGMNLATKIHFLTVFYNLRSAALSESRLRAEALASHGLNVSNLDILQLSSDDLRDYQATCNTYANSALEAIRLFRSDLEIIDRELDPPSDGPNSPPQASATNELSSYIYYLKLVSARNAIELENRRKQLVEFQQMLRVAIENNYQYMLKQEERARQCQTQLNVLEERAPVRRYAYR